MADLRVRYLLLGSALACSSRPIASEDSSESSEAGNTTSADTTSPDTTSPDTTVSGSSSETAAESESGVETETSTETGTDMEPPCVWEPAPPSECIPADQPAPPFDPTGYTMHDASLPSLEIGPDGALHVLAAQGGVDDDDNFLSWFSYQSNASGMWTGGRLQARLIPSPKLPSAISPSGVLHAARGRHVRGTDDAFFSSNPDIEPHSLWDIAWSRNGEYGYMYGYIEGLQGDLVIWSSDGNCMTAEWILPFCGYHRTIIAMDDDDRLHVLQVTWEEGFTLLTLDGDELSTKWMNVSPDHYSDIELGDFVIDTMGTMHMCYAIEHEQTPASVRYVRFTEFGDWEEFPIPELNPNESELAGPPGCSLAVDDDGTVVWMTASTAGDRLARIEDGVADIVPIDVPLDGDIELGDIELDDIDQLVLAGTCWTDVGTYFVMRHVGGMWQLEHSFMI